MKTIDLNWTHPTQRTDGEPVTEADIAGVRLYMSVNPTELGWDVINSTLIPPATKTYRLSDLSSGVYYFQAIWTDTDSVESGAANAQVEIPKEPLNSGTLTVTLV